MSKAYGDSDAIATALLTAVSIPGREPRPDVTEWIDKTVDALAPELKGEMRELLAKAHAVRQQIPDEPGSSEEAFEVTKQIYRNMAESAGIDLADSTSSWTRVVNIGLKDLDASRVLRRCEHIAIVHRQDNPVAKLLKMSTAGTKVLHCTKHGYRVVALELDEAAAELKQRHCDSCNDLAPREPDWAYSYEW